MRLTPPVLISLSMSLSAGWGCSHAGGASAPASATATACRTQAQDVGAGYDERASGIAREHALAVAEVACGMGEVIAFRPVNPSAAAWIAQGYATKGLTIHGKSSDKPLIQGLIPVDQHLSKLADESRIEHFNAENLGSLRHRDDGGRRDIVQALVHLDPSAHPGRVVCRTAGGALQEAELADEAVRRFYERSAAEEAPIHLEAATAKGEACEAVTVLAQPRPDAPLIKASPFTADYDLLLLASKAEVPRGAYAADQPSFGNGFQRDREVVACLNATLAAHGQKAQLVNHGSDQLNPAAEPMERDGATNAANLPALLFPPCRPPLVVKDRRELEQALEAFAREGFCVAVNPAWGVAPPELPPSCPSTGRPVSRAK
jgi:toxin LF subunit